MRRLLSSAILALAVGCTPAAQRPYVAPTRETVVSTTEERQGGGPPAHLIYVENHSTVPITVFGVSLANCENVKQQCSPHPTNIKVAPNGRQLALRVEASDQEKAFGYHFGFSWRADSSSAQALNVLAEHGDARAQAQVAARRHADSLASAEVGPRYNELSRNDFALLGARARSLRILPESLTIVPGQGANLEQVRLLVVDDAGVVAGQTRWYGWRLASANSAVAFSPPTTLVARAPGRATLRFRLADEAQELLPQVPTAEIELPVVVGYPFDAHAPTYDGIAVDADSKAPLGCIRVALEDSARNVVASAHADRGGVFTLRAPRPGSYRVRLEAAGWMPVGGPLQAAGPDESKQQQYAVRFTDRLIGGAFLGDPAADDYPHPIAVTASKFTAPPAGAVVGKSTKPVVVAAPRAVVRSVALRGSTAMPVLAVVGNAPAGTSWIEFVVDDQGRVDESSIVYPPGTDARAVGSVRLVLPHIRFAPATAEGHPVCELARMQVEFSAR